MKTYTFENRNGKWQLDFPTAESAVAHGKWNKADKVALHGVTLAETVDLEGGFRVFKVHKEIVRELS